MCVGEEQQKQKHTDMTGISVHIYMCMCVLTSAHSRISSSVNQATREKVEMAWLPELHTAFTNVAYSYDPLILQQRSVDGSVKNIEAARRITHLEFTFFSSFDDN